MNFAMGCDKTPCTCTTTRLLGPCFKTGQTQLMHAWIHSAMHKPAWNTSILAGFIYGCHCKVKLTNRSLTQSQYCTNMMRVTYYPHNNDSHHQKTHLAACMHTVQPAMQPHQSRHTPMTSFRWAAVLAWVQASSSSFNYVSKVLCSFPSRYLCSIGLKRMFSFILNLPHILHSIPKKCYCHKIATHRQNMCYTGLSP